MSRLYVIARAVATTLTRSSGQAALDTLASAIFDEFKTGGRSAIGATKVHVEWFDRGSTTLQVIIECSGLAQITATPSTLRDTVETGLEYQDAITDVTNLEVSFIDQGEEISDAGLVSQTNLIADWDPHRGVTGVADGGAVTTVTDKSPAGNNFTASGAQKPLFRKAALNGYGVCEFTGSSKHFMTCGTALGRPASFTIYGVFKLTTIASRQIPIGSMDSAGNNAPIWGRFDCNNGANGRLTYFFGRSAPLYSTGYTNDNPLVADTWALVVLRYAGGNTYNEFFVNGVQKATTATASLANASDGTTDTFSIGRCGSFDGVYATGRIARVLVYTAAHDTATRQAIEATLMGKYGLS